MAAAGGVGSSIASRSKAAEGGYTAGAAGAEGVATGAAGLGGSALTSSYFGGSSCAGTGGAASFGS